MSFPFIDAEEFRKLYPTFCDDSRPKPALPGTEIVFDTSRTPAAVVQEATMKNSPRYIGNVFYEELEELIADKNITIYTCNVKLMSFKGSGKARTKKMAKQIGCYELLKCAIGMDRYKDFLIPAKSKEEAFKILEKIKPVEETTDGENQAPAPPDNFIGKLAEFCTQDKLPPPSYEFSEDGAPNAKVFTAYAISGKFKGSAEGKKKKDAKNAAARALLKELESEMSSLRMKADQMQGRGGNMGVEDDEYEPIEGILGAPGVNVSGALTEPEPQKALEDILSDTTRFVSYNTLYRELDQPSSRGRSQTLLSVQYSKAPPQPIVQADGKVIIPKVDKDAPAVNNYVFCGEGMDVQSGRDEAARSALVHFLTYKGPRELTPASTPV